MTASISSVLSAPAGQLAAVDPCGERSSEGAAHRLDDSLLEPFHQLWMFVLFEQHGGDDAQAVAGRPRQRCISMRATRSSKPTPLVRLGQRGPQAVDHRRDEVALRSVAQVDGRLRHACHGGDLVDGHRLVATPSQQLLDGVEDGDVVRTVARHCSSLSFLGRRLTVTATRVV